MVGRDGLELVRQLLSLGWPLLPLPAREKGPRTTEWQKKVESPGYVLSDFAADANVGVGLGSPIRLANGEPGHLRLYDNDNDALEAIAAAAALMPDTGVVFGRDSKREAHRLYACAEVLITEQYRDIDDRTMLTELRGRSKTGGAAQTMVPPSVHPSGEAVVFVGDGTPIPAIVTGAQLREAVRNVAIAALVARHWPGAGRHDVRLALAGYLLRADLSADVAQAIIGVAAKLGGSDAAGIRDVEATVAATRAKIAAGQSATGGPTLADLLVDGEAVVARLDQWLGRQETAARDAAVADYNRTHFVIRVGGSKQKAVVGKDETFPPRFESFASFRDFYQNDRVRVGKRDEGRADLWLRDTRRRTYTGDLVFAPPPETAGPTDYNLWAGFAVTPDPEPEPARRCARYLQHVREVICDGNDEHAEFLLDVLAAKVQRPGAITEVVVVLKGGQGTGKGTLVDEYGQLFGRHFIQLDKPDHALGKFNASLSAKLVVFMDEAFWAGDRASIGAMKRLATERTILIERKGIDASPEPNFVQLFLATNERWAWPADLDDRRGFVLKVSDARAKDHAYFAALRDEMNAGGREALLAFLQQREIRSNLRVIPRTAAFAEQQALSLDPVQRWWKAKLEVGHTWRESDVWDQWISTQDAHEDYEETVRSGERPLSQDAFTKEWKRVLPVGVRAEKRRGVVDRADRLVGRNGTKRRWGLVLPDLRACRQAFDRAAGVAHPWTDDETWSDVRLPLDRRTTDGPALDRQEDPCSSR